MKTTKRRATACAARTLRTLAIAAGVALASATAIAQPVLNEGTVLLVLGAERPRDRIPVRGNCRSPFRRRRGAVHGVDGRCAD